MTLETYFPFSASDLVILKRLRDEAERIGRMLPLAEPVPLAPPVLSLAPLPLVAVVGAGWSGKTVLCRRLIGDTQSGGEPEATLSVSDHLLHFHTASASLLPTDIVPAISLSTLPANKSGACYVEFPAIMATQRDEPVFTRFLPRCDYVLLCIPSSRTIGQIEIEWLARYEALLPRHGCIVLTWADQADPDDLSICATEAEDYASHAAPNLIWDTPSAISGQFMDTDTAQRHSTEAALPEVVAQITGTSFAAKLLLESRTKTSHRLRTWYLEAITRLQNGEVQTGQALQQTATIRAKSNDAQQRLLTARKKYSEGVQKGLSSARSAFQRELEGCRVTWQKDLKEIIGRIESEENLPTVEKDLAQILLQFNYTVNRVVQDAALPAIETASLEYLKVIEPFLRATKNSPSLAERVTHLPSQSQMSAGTENSVNLHEDVITILAELEDATSGTQSTRKMRDGAFTVTLLTLGFHVPVVGWVLAPLAAGAYLFNSHKAGKEAKRAALRTAVQTQARTQFDQAMLAIRHESEDMFAQITKSLQERGDRWHKNAMNALGESVALEVGVAQERDKTATASRHAIGEARHLLALWERDRYALLGANTESPLPIFHAEPKESKT